MSMPNNPQYGAAMSPTQPQSDGATISFGDDNDVGAEEPQMPRAPSAHHEQALSFESRPTDMGWDVLQDEEAMSGTTFHGTRDYNTPGGLHMNPYPDISTNTGPYALQHAYPPPAMPYANLQPHAPYEMDAGTDAGQASHPQMNYQPGMSPSTLQDHHNVFLPNQSAMTASGFEPNNVGHFTGPSSSGPHPIQNPANASTSYQGPSEPKAKTNAWTQDQENLVRRRKHEGKTLKQIAYELKQRFGVVKSCNSVSKRLAIIKKRSSRVESKAVIQNVMPSLLQQVQLLNAKLGAAQNHHDPDPQVTGVMHEVEMQEHFQKGLTRLVEEWVFRGQVQVQNHGRHGGANL